MTQFILYSVHCTLIKFICRYIKNNFFLQNTRYYQKASSDFKYYYYNYYYYHYIIVQWTLDTAIALCRLHIKLLLKHCFVTTWNTQKYCYKVVFKVHNFLVVTVMMTLFLDPDVSNLGFSVSFVKLEFSYKRIDHKPQTLVFL